MSKRVTVGRTLPNRPVVRLTDALTFALYGIVAKGGPDATAYLPGGLDANQWSDGSVCVMKTAEGGLLHDLDTEEAGVEEERFFAYLAAAAAAGTLSFYGERRGGPFDTDLAAARIGADPIPPTFFNSAVEFLIEGGRIDFDFGDLDETDRDIVERVAPSGYQGEGRDFRGWGAVGVERVGFLSWLASYQGKLTEAADATPPNTSAYKTGLSGRPTSKHLIGPEIERRKRAGETRPTLKAEACALSAWLKQQHPDASSATPKTIMNSFRSEIREAILFVDPKTS